MPNMKSAIDANNKKIMQMQAPEPEDKDCNCRRKDECPLDGKCRMTNIVYQATILTAETNDRDKAKTETYIGLTQNEFKLRYANHKQSFRNEAYRKQTELSKHIWTLKDSKIEYTIKWKIVRRAKPYTNISKRCNLCLMEKYFIICHPNMASLNRRSELLNTCRHASKFKLINHKRAT